MAEAPAAPEPSRRRRELYAFLEIAALCGLAVTQPLLDITGKSPDFFLFYGAGAGEVLLLVLLVTLVPPVVLWGMGALVGLAGRTPRTVIHAATVGGLVAVLAVQVGKNLSGVRGVPLALLAILVAAGLTLAYLRWRAPAQLLRFAAVGPVVFALLFVFASPSSAVVLARGGDSGSAADRNTGQHPPIVVLLLDEFPLVSLLGPDGKIDAARYPNFARLAGGSTWYRNATGVSGWTPYAVPAMLTGKYPAKDNAAPHFSEHPDNLFSLLDDSYDMQVRESITQLCLPSVCERDTPQGGLPVLLGESAKLLRQLASPSDSTQKPEESYQEATEKEADDAPPPASPDFRFDRLGENQPARFTDFLAGLRPADKPTLHFLHLLMPHGPWSYLPSGVRYESPDIAGDDGGAGDGRVRLAQQRHLEQVGYTDRLIGETLDAMAASKLYDDALLVVTADHGVSFTPDAQGRGIGSVQKAGDEVLWVPLFVKEPGQSTGRVDDRNWEQVDLLPTVADLAGVTIPWQVDGVSAVHQARDRVDKRYHDLPSKRVTVPGPANFAEVLRGSAGRSPRLANPRPELMGKPVDQVPAATLRDGPSVANEDAFREVDPASGTVPALVWGTVPPSIRDGTLLAVAVNGRVGAITQATEPDGAGLRFAVLITDESLFRTGANEVSVVVLE